MALISYSFCMSMLHSLWQAGVLLLVYQAADGIFLSKASPLAKRNLLLLMLGSQFVVFLATFFLYLFPASDALYPQHLADWSDSLFPSATMSFISPFLFIAYLCVVFYRLSRFLYAWKRFGQLYQTGLLKPGIDLKLFTESRAHQFGIRRKVGLWLSNTIHTPVTFGFVKPVILLPVALVNNISSRQAEALILHELTHIRWNDYPLNWFLMILENVFFFNPVVLSWCKKIRLERELNCDMSVIAFEYPPALYASALLQAERLKQNAPEFQLAAVSHKKELLRRIEFFSHEKNKTKIETAGFIPFLIGLGFLLTLYSVLFFNVAGPGNSHFSGPLPTGVIPAGFIAYNNGLAENEILTPSAQSNPGSIAGIYSGQTNLAPAIKNKKRIVPAQPGTKQNRKYDTGTEQGGLLRVAEKTVDGESEIIVKEESSGSRSSSVKVYRLKYLNGEWVITPGWMAATRELSDSDALARMHDSSMKTNQSISQQ